MSSFDIALHDIIIFMSASDIFILFIIAMHFESFIMLSLGMAMQLCIMFFSLLDIFIADADWANPATPTSIARPRLADLKEFIARLLVEGVLSRRAAAQR